MISNMDLYWIGGSPCCGKSTISEMLVRDFGFCLYKCDDSLNRYIEIGVKNNNELMKKIDKRTLDEIWLRDIDEQVEEEFEFYRVALEIIKKELLENYQNKKVIIEGAAILPEFIQASKICTDRYVCMVPTKKFQVEQYKKRKWVTHYLASCSNPDKAFSNWMERDHRYAQIVMDQAKNNDMSLLLVDGTVNISDMYGEVRRIFKLSK